MFQKIKSGCRAMTDWCPVLRPNWISKPPYRDADRPRSDDALLGGEQTVRWTWQKGHGNLRRKIAMPKRGQPRYPIREYSRFFVYTHSLATTFWWSHFLFERKFATCLFGVSLSKWNIYAPPPQRFLSRNVRNFYHWWRKGFLNTRCIQKMVVIQ